MSDPCLPFLTFVPRARARAEGQLPSQRSSPARQRLNSSACHRQSHRSGASRGPLAWRSEAESDQDESELINISTRALGLTLARAISERLEGLASEWMTGCGRGKVSGAPAPRSRVRGPRKVSTTCFDFPNGKTRHPSAGELPRSLSSVAELLKCTRSLASAQSEAPALPQTSLSHAHPPLIGRVSVPSGASLSLRRTRGPLALCTDTPWWARQRESTRRPAQVLRGLRGAVHRGRNSRRTRGGGCCLPSGRCGPWAACITAVWGL